MRNELDPTTALAVAPETYDVWLATGFSVRAASCAEAEARAAVWLAALLANADSPDGPNAPVAPGITVTRPAQNLERAAVLALQLMALEKKDGEVLEHVHRLRAQLEDDRAFT